MGRGEVQARRPVRIVVVLVLRKEDSKCQIYTFGEVGLSQVLCADWPLTRRVVQLIGAGGGSGGEQRRSVQRSGGLFSFTKATSNCEGSLSPQASLS